MADQPQKKSKKDKKSKDASNPEASAPAQPGPQSFTPKQLQEILRLNPALASELQHAASSTSSQPSSSSADPSTQSPSISPAADALRKLSLADMLTGMAPGGKNKTDMASYKFWQTQPVPRFDEDVSSLPDGPLKTPTLDQIRKEPAPMLPGYEWVTVDVTDAAQLEEVYALLTGHYVEDDEAQFRFRYSAGFLSWALKAPGWRGEWHVGVRVSASRKLVAFISGIPVKVRIRDKTLDSAEINFLCIHKKLRSKRLAPELIKEVTRRINLEEIYQAVYTAGVLLPKPIATCRYYHRSLNWPKLHAVKFSPLPPGSTPARQILRYRVPDKTATAGLREMTEADVPQVASLLARFLERYELAPVFSEAELRHWLLHDPEQCAERVTWSYVVEDVNQKGKIGDFFSFYALDSTVVQSAGKVEVVHAAYLFYYATDAASATATPAEEDKAGKAAKKHLTLQRALLKIRLNQLMADALVLAKKEGFDVFNALTLLDNALFLEDQKFGPGDGYLHYYLYNYRTKGIGGGTDAKMRLDEEKGSGIGVIML